MRTHLRAFIVALVASLIVGCAVTQTYAPDTAPEMVIVFDMTPFYRLGPMQASRPNASLPVGTRVKMLRKEMGYSLIQIPDTRTGYVANENMASAPPLPPSPPEMAGDIAPKSGKKGKIRDQDDSPIYTGEQVNDTPLPDLNIADELIPDDVAPNKTEPMPPPKFRY